MTKTVWLSFIETPCRIVFIISKPGSGILGIN